MTFESPAAAKAGDAAPPPRPAAAPALACALAGELEAERWDLPWRLAPGLVTPVADPGARHAAWSLERMLEAPVRDALAMRGGEMDALDLACGEGALGHALIRWGAKPVVGIETHARRLRRAELIRDHFRVPATSLELRGADDLGSLDPAALGTFDVVMLVGIFDRVGEPGALIRLARDCTRGLCAVETAGADAAGHAQALRDAGFTSVSRVPPPPDAEARYARQERSVLLALPGETA